jgi:hypothetical protein
MNQLPAIEGRSDILKANMDPLYLTPVNGLMPAM